ncbi:MAG: DUF5674 family protein [Candidatus Dependentiae bacterium]
MKLVEKEIFLEELKQMSTKMFEALVKAVVDVEKEVMIVDAPMHVDQETWLLEKYDSKQENLWGINLYPQHWGKPEFIKFDSMINLRPSQGNRSRTVENPQIQQKIIKIVMKLVKP